MSAAPPGVQAVTLTAAEMYHAELIADVRQKLAEREGRQDTYGYEGDGLTIHRDGCYAEIAVARVTGLYWHALLSREDRKRLPDVGRDIGVRAVAEQHRNGKKGRLMVHKPDKDFHRYVLVDGEAPNLVIVGWAWGADAKNEDYWSDPSRKNRWAFFMPREHLCHTRL